MLPLVVDAIGWNIQIRTTHLDYRPPYPDGLVPGELGTGEGADHAAGYKNLVWHPDLAGPYIFEAPALDGRLPFMEIKVGYYLSDLTERNPGAICLVPGSHRRPPSELRELGRLGSRLAMSASGANTVKRRRTAPPTRILSRVTVSNLVGLVVETLGLVERPECELMNYDVRWLLVGEYDCARDILCLQRIYRLDEWSHFGCAACKRCIHCSRLDNRDANAKTPDLLANRVGEADHSEFTRDIRGLADVRLSSRS